MPSAGVKYSGQVLAQSLFLLFFKGGDFVNVKQNLCA